VIAASRAPRRRVAVIISGRGSNMRTLIESGRATDSNFEVTLVLSDKGDAGGLQVARELGVEARAIPAAGIRDRSAYDSLLSEALSAHAPDVIALAGFMRILSGGFVRNFAGKLLNIHPSLLPKYTGLHTHRRALAAGDAEHGVTVHYVTEELDGGPRVLQARTPILPGDDESTLSARVQQLEHKIYPQVVRWHCADRLLYRDHCAWFDGRLLQEPLQWSDSIS
jgi:phosphoribosylglycinamide formyltransferase-1